MQRSELDPNTVFKMLMEVFLVAGYEKEDARALAGDFWKKIYIDAVLLMAENNENADKNRLRELAGKGIMTELLIAALDYVPKEEIEKYVSQVAGEYGRIMAEEIKTNLDDEKQKKIEHIWRSYGEKMGMVDGGLGIATDNSDHQEQQAPEEVTALGTGEEGLLESGQEGLLESSISNEQQVQNE